jgi:steroid delta-isomerase-like uncharacterized protein
MKNESESVSLMHRWFEEVWNKGRESAIDEMFAEDAVAHGLADENGAELRGPAGFKPFFKKFRDAFPNIQVTIEDCFAEGDRAVARCRVRANHTGEGFGIAATGKPIEFTGIAIIRVSDGKIIEAWNNFDFLSLNQQLGVL